jgi:hypothetical protein
VLLLFDAGAAANHHAVNRRTGFVATDGPAILQIAARD